MKKSSQNSKLKEQIKKKKTLSKKKSCSVQIDKEKLGEIKESEVEIDSSL
jgi:hypothetical protein